MSAPTPYTRLKNFVQYALDHTSAPYNASDHDAEFDAIYLTLSGVVTNLNTIQRNDGLLANSSVHVDAFSTAALALIAATWTPKGLWVTATAYVIGDVVQNGTTSYVCSVAHTSGVFATDQGAGKWVTLGKTNGDVASGIAFTPYGHIAAVNVQAAIQELVDEKALLAGSSAQAFSVQDATGRNNAASVGQIQRNALMSATAAGTADALTATFNSTETVYADKMRFLVRAVAANTSTAPTLTPTLGATVLAGKTIKKGAGSALVVGDIAGAGHELDLVYDLTLDCILLLNPAFPVGVSTATVAPNDVRNVGLSFSVGASALTANVTTATGGSPSSSDPVQAAMRDATASNGKYNTRSIIAPTSLVVPSGATLGHSSAVASRMHWYLIDNAGTLELAVSSAFLGTSGIVSTTAISAASANPNVMYSTSARANVPFSWIGSTIDTQAAAGTWAATPSAVDLVRREDSYGSAVIAVGRNIQAKNNAGTPGSKLDVSADMLVLQDGFGGVMKVNNVSVTIDFGAAVGANGPDAAGAQSANSWSYGWIIAKPDGTVAGLGSASSSVPTMPAGYTYRALVTACYTTGGFRNYRQLGNEVYYNVDNTVVSGGTSTSSSTVSVATYVPPNALAFDIYVKGFQNTSNGSGQSQFSLVIEAIPGTAVFQNDINVQGQAGSAHIYNPGGTGNIRLPNIGQQFAYYLVTSLGSATGVSVGLMNFKLPMGGE